MRSTSAFRSAWAGNGASIELIRYFGVMGFSLALNLGLMVLLVEVVGLHYLVASLVLSAMFAAFNYFGHRSVTFRLSSRRKPDRAAGRQGPLKVLQVSAFFPAHGGGIEAVAGHLAASMAPRGVQARMDGGRSSRRHAGCERIPRRHDRTRAFH